MIHRIVDEQSETNHLGEILITIGFIQVVNVLYIMHVKTLILTDHGLAMRVLLPSLQCALETKRQNILLKFHINCAIVDI